MLVLSRKVDERVFVGGNIEVVVVAVTNDRVKLGFIAPSDISIHREEIHRRMQAEERAREVCNAPQP